ncbi:hypothetical protein P4110_11155 [Pseudomonas aeruginosa]|nr:hypothetical protein [Pseudomonas aeruginosa]
MEDGSLPHAIVQTFKGRGHKWVFCIREVEIELQGYRIIQGLLFFYAPPLRLAGPRSSVPSPKVAPGRRAAFATAGSGACRASRSRLTLEASESGGGGPWLQRQWEFYHRCRMLRDFRQRHDRPACSKM